MNGREAAKTDVFPGGGLSDEAHRKLARLQEGMEQQKLVGRTWCKCGHHKGNHAPTPRISGSSCLEQACRCTRFQSAVVPTKGESDA